jgi:hypothetical protein
MPNSVNVRHIILQEEHHTNVVDHTDERVRRNFFGPQMNQRIDHYVHSCHDGQKNMQEHSARYGVLQQLE